MSLQAPGGARRWDSPKGDANLLDSHSEVQAQEAVRWATGQQHILELIARSAPLVQILEALTTLVEQETPSVLCSILLMDENEEVLRPGAAPSLPQEFQEAVDGLPVCEVGSCAAAAARRAQVVTEDIATHPLWAEHRDWMVNKMGLRSAWSTPVFSSNDELLGIFALYGRRPGPPAPGAEALIQKATYLAGIAMERVRDVENLRRAKVEAEEASYAKSKFLANISHELRTPLNAIIGYSEILVEELTDMGHAELADDLRNIRQAGQRLLSMIGSVLDMSKIQAEMMAITPSRFSLSSVAENVVAEARRYVADKGNALEVHLQSEVDDMFSDATRVVQIVQNLLSNANKFTEEGDISLRVTQERADGQDIVVFQVSDTGIGIAPERLEVLFKPFAKVDDPEHAKRTGGIGLGLALSQQLCTMLGGEIEAQSELGRGSTFTVRLPLVYPTDAFVDS